MKHQLPAPLVRFHIHMLRDQATQLVALANALAQRKGATHAWVKPWNWPWLPA